MVNNKQGMEKIVIVCSCIMLVIGLFSMDLYNPSLPYIVQSIHITQTTARNLVVFYLVGFSGSQLIYGPLSDRYGRKVVIITSLALAVLGNALTIFATTGHQIAYDRLLTGIGAGGCPVISRAILTDTFLDKSSLSRAFTIFSMSSQISPAFAPIIGGVIQQYYSWRGAFVALALLTLIALLVLFILPETCRNKRPLNFTNLYNGYKATITNFKFMLYSVISALLFSFTIGYYTTSPFIFKNEFHLLPMENGMIYIFYALGVVIGSYLTKRLIGRYEGEKILNFGIFSLVILSVIFVSVTYVSSSVESVIILTWLNAICCGSAAPLLISLSIHNLPGISGIASAIQGTIKMAGTALTLMFFSYVNIDSTLDLAYFFLVLSILNGCLLFVAHLYERFHRSIAVVDEVYEK